jgi:predicted cupin superfamily sugar epimerase
VGAVYQIVERLGLVPHPEGGFYRETYRAQGKFGGHEYSTGIYYLLCPGQKSALHRITSDEMWHFYLGGPLRIGEISPDGTVRETLLGQNLAQGEVPQHTVLAGNWFGASLEREGDYCLVGCTVSPAFDFKNFELGAREALLAEFPQAKELILRLT